MACVNQTAPHWNTRRVDSKERKTGCVKGTKNRRFEEVSQVLVPLCVFVWVTDAER